MQTKFQLYSLYLAAKLRLHRMIKNRGKKEEKEISV
jgi:hypothetical protein